MQENDCCDEIVFVSQKDGQVGLLNEPILTQIERFLKDEKVNNFHIIFWFQMLKDYLISNKKNFIEGLNNLSNFQNANYNPKYKNKFKNIIPLKYHRIIIIGSVFLM